MGRADGVDQLGGRGPVDVGPAGDDHGVGAHEPVEPPVGLQPEPPGPYGVRPAEREPVPGFRSVGRMGPEDLAGQGEFEVQHAVGDGERGRSDQTFLVDVVVRSGGA